MDVDVQETTAAPATDNQLLVNELGSVLESVAASPNNVRLLRHQVDLMIDVGMVDEAADAADTVCDIAFLGESACVPLSGGQLTGSR